MLINNAIVFPTLVGTGAPQIIYTLYNPTQHWARQELETCGPGSIVIQLTGTCPGGCELGTVWAKRARTAGNGENDYIALTTQAFMGTTTPSASAADLCAAPLGSYYVKKNGSGGIEQIYVKINNTCSNVSVIHDWHPLMLTVTRLGDDFSFDAASYTINLPISGRLTEDADNPGRYTWTPDDGSDPTLFYVPILTDNEDGTYTYDLNDGTTTPISIVSTVPSIPTDISAIRRPWTEIGSAASTNATNVENSDHIWHTGKMVRGATSIGGTNVDGELRGNNSLGGGNANMTGATNSTTGGTGASLQSTANAIIAAGESNLITGVGDPTLWINSGIVGGQSNAITNSKNAVIGGGYQNVITDSSSSFIGGGDGNQATVAGAAVVVGGTNNKANGNRGQVLGGTFNEANAFAATALGLKAQITHNYAFLINTLPGADVNTDSDPFNSASVSEFGVRCDNVRIFTNLAQSSGVTMAAGASAWVAVSDRRTKNNITLLDAAVLDGYRRLQVVSYQQGADDIGAGVVAQNFYEAFPFIPVKMIGEMYAINQMDHDGVQDKAIKELLQIVDRLYQRIAALENRLS